MDSIFQNLLLSQTKQPNLDLEYNTSPRTQYFQQSAANQLQDYAPALSTLSEYNDNNLNQLNNLLKLNLNDNFLAQSEQVLGKAKDLDNEFKQKAFNDALKLANIKRNWAKQDADEARRLQEEDEIARRKAAVERILYQKSKEQQNNLPYIGRNFAGVNPNQTRIDDLVNQYNDTTNLSNIGDNLDYTDKYNLDIQLEKALDKNDLNNQSLLNEIKSLVNDRTVPDYYRKVGGESYFTGQNLTQPIKINKGNESTQNVLAAMDNNPLQEYYLNKNFRSGNLFNTTTFSPQQKENLRSVADFMDEGGYNFLNNGYDDLPSAVSEGLTSMGININDFVPIVTVDGDLKLIDKETNTIYDPVIDNSGIHLEVLSEPNKLGMFDTMINYLIGK